MRPEESLAKMVESLSTTTGKTLDEWRVILAQRGLTKHSDMMKTLKEEFGISHGYANQIALRARETETDVDPTEALFAKRAEANAVFDALMPQIEAFGADIDVAPKKTYLSVRRAKQFAILQPAAGRLDVGIQLKGVEPTSRLEASGSFNAMVSHRVRVSSPAEIDAELLSWLRQAYDLA